MTDARPVLVTGGSRGTPWEDEAFCDPLRTEPDLGTLRRIDDQFFGALAGG